ncbi:MAG: hypothetical protein ACREQ1_09795 [Woeseiaceae bacterium]
MSEGMHAVYRLCDRDEEHARHAQAPLRQLREDGDFYIPDFLTAEPYKSRARVYAAANDHARDLRKAEQKLDDVVNLAGVLRASVQGEDDGRAMQADTVLKIIERKLSKAQACIDRHDARHLNLFMAYFNLKEGSSGNTED